MLRRASYDLLDLDAGDLPRVEVDALLERPAEPVAARGDDPAFLDDEVLDHPPADEGRAQDRGVLPLRHAVRDEQLAPLFWQHFGEAVARRFLRMHQAITLDM